MTHFSHQFIFQGNLIWSHIDVSQIHLVLPTFLHFNHIFLSISWSDHKNPSLVIFQKQTLSFLGKYSLSFNGTGVFPVLKFRILGSSMIPLWLTGCQRPTCVHSRLLQSFPTLSNPLDCSPPGCSVYGILLARILEWIAMPSSRGSFRPKDQTSVS